MGLMLRRGLLLGVAGVLAGCVGQPRTYAPQRPIVLRPPGRRTPAQAPAPAPAPSAAAPPSAPSAVPLSAAEKERLFREFQGSQSNPAP